MAQNEIYPVAIQYLHKLATTCNEMKSLGVDVDYLMASKIVEKEIAKDKYDLPLEEFIQESKKDK